ncbi:MAG: [glutamate--ammonia-ligase] adenylyltransferase [Aureliella sp.]
MDDAIRDAIAGLRVIDTPALSEKLTKFYTLGCPEDAVETFIVSLAHALADCPDADRVVGHTIELLRAVRSPLAWLSLFEREPASLQTLVRLFTVSDYFAERLILDPESFDILQMTGGEPTSLEVLHDELVAEASAATNEAALTGLLGRFRHRETLRIAYGEFMCGHSAATVASQLSDLADCIVSVALQSVIRLGRERSGRASAPDSTPAPFSVLALGSLGGKEMGYSDALDLVFIRDEVAESHTRGTRSGDTVAGEYFNRLASKLVSILSTTSGDGAAYDVRSTLRPGGASGPMVAKVRDALDHFDAKGRTWERQAYLKARVVGGDCVFGCSFLDDLEHWVFRRYLMRADITGIAALKRRLTRKTEPGNTGSLNIYETPGGISDIEQVVQFLQLLHGSETPGVRSPNTLDALNRLEKERCITADELEILRNSHEYFARLVHASEMIRLGEVREIPTRGAQLDSFVARLAHLEIVSLEKPVLVPDGQAEQRGAAEFMTQLQERLNQTRKVVDHLLASAFEDETPPNLATDLVLDPEPNQDSIASVFDPLGFRDPTAAYRHLQSLAEETIPFLSTRRCRHFLAAIAPSLLEAIAETPDPDATLISLTNVTDSIGGKAVLWELFSSNRATLDLALRLCAASPYLSSILTSNPGMIDELLDSLMLETLPTRDKLGEQLQELCAGADEIGPILQSFKNSMHLRVGARNILRKDPLRRIHQALSDIAEVCLEQVVQHEYHRLVRQLGVPVIDNLQPTSGAENVLASEPNAPAGVLTAATVQPDTFQAAELVVLAVGKLGGQEPNYHSDIDLIFLFEGDGQTRSLVPDRRFSPTTNRHFFNQLCQRIVNALTRTGSTGKLYDVDVGLRPRGASGQLVITADELKDHFAGGNGEIGERLVLCKARPVWGSSRGQAAVLESVRDILTSQSLGGEQADALLALRRSLEQSASPGNIKRSSGGTMDIEFAVQAVQLASIDAIDHPLPTGTVAAIEQLVEHGKLDEARGTEMCDNYTFLRRVESALRLMNMSARHDIPSEASTLRQLAFLLSEPGSDLDNEAEELTEQISAVRCRNREILFEVLNPFLPAEDAD